MAMTPQEKKAYAKEYYQKYTKKGLKKGRKKGKKKKAATSSLLGVSSAGLNPDGMIEAAVIKETLKKEMNAALAKAKTPEEQLAIRKEYSKKANDQIQKLKSDPKFAKAKTPRTTTSSKTPKSSSSSGSSSKSRSESRSGSRSESNSSQTQSQVQPQTQTQTQTQDQTQKVSEPAIETPAPTTEEEQLQTISDHIQELSAVLASLSVEQKQVVKNQISDILDNLKARLKEKLQSFAR